MGITTPPKNILAVICILIVVTTAVIVVAVDQQTKDAALCRKSLWRNYMGLMMYSGENDDRLPHLDWQRQVLRLQGGDWRRISCPLVWSPSNPQACGIAVNSDFVGRTLSSIDGASAPILFESAVMGPSAIAGISSMPVPGRHRGENNVCSLTGALAAVRDGVR